MPATVSYPNWQSRIFARRIFRNQFAVPRVPAKPYHTLLRWYERLLRVDVRTIGIDQPIFLIGMHRSGTTMLQDVLGAHPDVGYFTHLMQVFPDSLCGAEHLRQFLRLNASGERYLLDGVCVSNTSPNEGVVIWERWFGENSTSPAPSPRLTTGFTEDDKDAIHDTVRRCLWCFGGKATRFLSKNPRLVPYVSILAELFPDAIFIHLIRDPRPCANSMAKLYRMSQEQLEQILSDGRPHGVFDDAPFLPYPRLPRLAEYVERYGPDDLRTTASLWRDGVESVERQGLSIGRFYTVRYEDVLARPKHEIAALLEACQLSAVPDGHEFWRMVDGIGQIDRRNAYQSFDLIEGICRDVMGRHGYLREAA